MVTVHATFFSNIFSPIGGFHILPFIREVGGWCKTYGVVRGIKGLAKVEGVQVSGVITYLPRHIYVPPPPPDKSQNPDPSKCFLC